MHDLVTYLKSLDSQSVLVGVGNPLRGDDGFGPELVGRLGEAVPFKTIDAGEEPEDCLEQVLALKPSRVLIADAVAFGGKPGEAVLLEPESLGKKITVSTHQLPLMMFIRLIRERLAGAEVKVLGLQPKSIELGKGLSSQVDQSMDMLVQIITGAAPAGLGKNRGRKVH
jgi:hydrogenase 3 maturation protease